MKKRLPVKLMTTTFLSAVLMIGCAQTQEKAASGGASKASPEAAAAIKEASDAIKVAKGNNWIWRDTEQFLKQAKEAADKGDSDTAVKLANKAKFEAEAAVTQYNLEKNNPRGF
jgi:pectate lyase